MDRLNQMNQMNQMNQLKLPKQMKVINKMLKPKKGSETMLLIVLVIYILTNVQTPKPLAKVVDNVYGNATVTMVAILIFLKTNIIVGVMSIVAAYELIKRSSVATGSHAMRNFVPSEHKKITDFEKYNEVPETLEEEIISKMAPLVKSAPTTNATYKPVLGDLHEASSATSDEM